MVGVNWPVFPSGSGIETSVTMYMRGRWNRHRWEAGAPPSIRLWQFHYGIEANGKQNGYSWRSWINVRAGPSRYLFVRTFASLPSFRGGDRMADRGARWLAAIAHPCGVAIVKLNRDKHVKSALPVSPGFRESSAPPAGFVSARLCVKWNSNRSDSSASATSLSELVGLIHRWVYSAESRVWLSGLIWRD
jgi:hypothetical protein